MNAVKLHRIGTKLRRLQRFRIVNSDIACVNEQSLPVQAEGFNAAEVGTDDIFFVGVQRERRMAGSEVRTFNLIVAKVIENLLN